MFLNLARSRRPVIMGRPSHTGSKPNSNAQSRGSWMPIIYSPFCLLATAKRNFEAGQGDRGKSKVCQRMD